VSDNLATRTRVNQQKLFAELKPHYDFISTQLYASRGSSPITGWHASERASGQFVDQSRRGHSVTDDDHRLAHGISLFGRLTRPYASEIM